mmetsp:Transcript_84046/g.241603  ORF Transcript_84046/g.241603 Transcript_84046/m.241603 type:complete len:490 (+) Transcript_84046:964-2433(+)
MRLRSTFLKTSSPLGSRATHRWTSLLGFGPPAAPSSSSALSSQMCTWAWRRCPTWRAAARGRRRRRCRASQRLSRILCFSAARTRLPFSSSTTAASRYRTADGPSCRAPPTTSGSRSRRRNSAATATRSSSAGPESLGASTEIRTTRASVGPSASPPTPRPAAVTGVDWHGSRASSPWRGARRTPGAPTCTPLTTSVSDHRCLPSSPRMQPRAPPAWARWPGTSKGRRHAQITCTGHHRSSFAGRPSAGMAAGAATASPCASVGRSTTPGCGTEACCRGRRRRTRLPARTSGRLSRSLRRAADTMAVPAAPTVLPTPRRPQAQLAALATPPRPQASARSRIPRRPLSTPSGIRAAKAGASAAWQMAIIRSAAIVASARIRRAPTLGPPTRTYWTPGRHRRRPSALRAPIGSEATTRVASLLPACSSLASCFGSSGQAARTGETAWRCTQAWHMRSGSTQTRAEATRSTQASSPSWSWAASGRSLETPTT